MIPFADAVVARCADLDCPIVAGIDPRPDLLSDDLRRRFGGSARGLARAYERFADGVLEGLLDLVPAVKVQIAFYEALGLPGVRAYAHTLRQARRMGFLVIADIKRGDIGSTAEAYVEGHLGGVAADAGADADAVTVNPYLGHDSLQPFLKTAHERGKGLFALVRTSNPGARDLQDLDVGGRPLWEHVADHVDRWGADLRGTSGYSGLGAVMGATYPAELARVRELHPNLLLLVPGYGAQGGRADDVVAALDRNGAGALIASSRGILKGFSAAARAGQRPSDGVRREAEAMRDDLRQAFARRRNEGAR